MRQNQKKVFIIDNVRSPNVEQAIIILKDNTKACGDDIVSEAESIIMNYLNSQAAGVRTPKASERDEVLLRILLNTVIVSAIGVFIYIIAKFIF